VLGPQADGAGNDLLVGRYMQIGLIFYTIGTIPSIILWSWMMEPAVLWLGFDLETAQIAQGYAYPLVTMGFIGGAGEVLDAFLEFMDHETYAMFMEIFAVGIDLVVIIIMVTSGVKDLVLIGIVQVLVGFLLMILSITIVLCNGWLDDVWEGLALSFGLKDKRAVKNMVKTAIPLGISYVLTYGEWEIMTLFAKFMGPAEVAAWGVLGFLWDTFEYTIDGLADAVEVRVGKGMGAGDTQSARSSAYKGLYLSIVISVYSAAFLFIVSGHLPKWLTPDPTLQRLIFETLPLIGFGEVLMSVGMVCWNVVGAQGRVRLATTIEFFVSWFLVIPMAAVLVYIFNFNLMGMVGPLVLGYTVGSVAITYLLVRSDWEGLSRKVIEINGGNISYDEVSSLRGECFSDETGRNVSLITKFVSLNNSTTGMTYLHWLGKQPLFLVTSRNYGIMTRNHRLRTRNGVI
jgi:MATE family multidrug resistance protein